MVCSRVTLSAPSNRRLHPTPLNPTAQLDRYISADIKGRRKADSTRSARLVENVVDFKHRWHIFLQNLLRPNLLRHLDCFCFCFLIIVHGVVALCGMVTVKLSKATVLAQPLSLPLLYYTANCLK